VVGLLAPLSFGEGLGVRLYMKKILFVFGTRPEAIKLAPLIEEMRKFPELFDIKVCVTAQQRQMLDQVLNFFSIVPEFDLNIMLENQSLFDITILTLKLIKDVISDFIPDIIIVQGDTTTSFVAALAGYYFKIKVAHVEAGLRSFNKYSPYPEEINRILTGHIADYHFAPTQMAVDSLKKEGIIHNVFMTTNTVIDALYLGLDIIKQKGQEKYSEFFDFINFRNRIILVTGHRRESFGVPFRNLCEGILQIADSFEDIEIVYPVHLNPNVRNPVNDILKGHKRIHLIEPLDYPYFIWLMNCSYLILTDSGGVQEEAPSLGKPVLVMRDVTERMEGVEAGTAKLVGTSTTKIIEETSLLLKNKKEYDKMSSNNNPYGDGNACKRIVEILSKI
jgi:UDP-N-acetylglucosamine 2-epimerase (non-hydrolysing)